MRKISILKRKIFKKFNNESLWKHSASRGYPLYTFYGYSSFDDYKTAMINYYREFYGHTLRMWKYT